MKKLSVYLLFVLLVGAVLVFYHVLTSSFLVTNQSPYTLTDVKVFKPRQNSAEIMIWQGDIPPNNHKRIKVPSGDSDDALLVEGVIDGTYFVERFGFSAIGGDTFVLRISEDKDINIQTKSKL